jgi:pantoate--beta-alanine ligase
MKVFKESAKLSELNRPIAYIPTMGALHGGHMALVAAGKKLAPNTLVSIFVNPLQFESTVDLNTYPVDLAGDQSKLESVGTDYLWLPEKSVVADQAIKLSSGEIGKLFEGKSRAGHFDGVLTIVARYLELVKPDYLIMGEKDWQQFTLISNYLKEIKSAVKIVGVPTVRAENGLALSSRNAKLSQMGKVKASVISKALFAACQETTAAAAIKVGQQVLASVPEIEIDYLSVIDSNDFREVPPSQVGDRIIFAGWLEGIRLLDNVAMAGA